MGPENAHIRRTGGTLFLICLLVYGTTAGGSLATSDAVVTYELTNSLMHGSVAIPRSVLGLEAVRGPDGRTYSAFGIGQSIYNIPFYCAGTAARDVLGLRLGKPDTIPKAAVAMGGAVAAAGAVWATFLLAWHLSGSASGSVAAALILAFATSLWPYSKFGFNAPLAMMLLALATYAMLAGIRDGSRRMQWWAGVLFAAAYLTRHEMALSAAVACVVLAIESRGDRRLLAERVGRFLPGMIVAIGFQLLYNFARFGNPLDTGHLRDSVPGFGSSLVAGLGGLLLSPGASLFLYSPPALLGVIALAVLWRRDRGAGWLIGGQVVLLLLLFATMGNWMGGRSYGPRYLVPLLPFLCAPLAVWPGWPSGRPILAAAFVAGLLVQLPGVLVDFSKVSIAVARRTDQPPAAGYTWHTSPLALNTRAAADAIPANVRYLFGVEAPPPVRRTATGGDRDFAQQLGFSLDFWWLYLFYLGAIPAAVAVAAGTVPLAAAAVIGMRLRPGGTRAGARAGPEIRSRARMKSARDFLDGLLRVPERSPGQTIAAIGLALTLAYTAGLLLLPKQHGRIVTGDALHYYVYVRSAVFDRDLEFTNDYAELLYHGRPRKPGAWMPATTETGHARNVMSVGPAILWAPLFLLSGAVVSIGRLFGVGYPLDGFGRLFQASAGYTGVVAATAGAWLTFRMLSRMFSVRASIWAVLGVWLGTNAIYYSVISPAYSHAPSMFAVALFFLAWTSSLARQTPARYGLIGAAAGFAALMRWQDAVLLILPVLDVLYHRPGAKRGLLNLLACGAAFAIAFLPQMIAWWVLYGSPVVIPQGEGFMRWSSPSVAAVLFSARRGLFTWTPLVAASVAGLFLAWRRQPLVAAGAIVAFCLALYVNAVVADWWAGEAYGARRFLSCFPVFALGLAALLDRVPRWHRTAAGLICVLVLLNGLLLLQYQLAMHGMETVAPYPETWYDLWVARFLVPIRLLMAVFS